MKKVIITLLVACLCFILSACGSGSVPKKTDESQIDVKAAKTNGQSKNLEGEAAKPASKGNNSQAAAESASTKTLVVYFSCTGHTKKLAEYLADGLEANLYEIVPQEPYTEEDLNYNNNASRTTKEMNDAKIRPAISDSVENIEQYNTIFLGYPIWWGEAPRILDTFVESYDLTDKAIIPFCTSGSSGIGSTAETLESLAGSGNWKEGKRFSGSTSEAEIMEWANQFEID